LSGRSGPRARAPGAPLDTTRTLARSKLQFHLEAHEIKIVTIDTHGHHELAAVLAEPYLTETMVGRERLDEPCGLAEGLIISQRQIHPVIIPDLRTSVEHGLRPVANRSRRLSLSRRVSRRCTSWVTTPDSFRWRASPGPRSGAHGLGGAEADWRPAA
jgi:hypothetical protein